MAKPVVESTANAPEHQISNKRATMDLDDDTRRSKRLSQSTKQSSYITTINTTIVLFFYPLCRLADVDDLFLLSLPQSYCMILIHFFCFVLCARSIPQFYHLTSVQKFLYSGRGQCRISPIILQ